MKKEYRVLVTETLQKTVIVEASSEEEAHRRAEDAWANTEYILDEDDFQGAEFYVLGEMDGTDASEGMERVAGKDS